MIKVGIIGSTGYAGQEIVRILLGHKEAEIVWYGSRSFIDQKYYQVYGNMFQIVDAKCMDDNMEELASKVDVIFTATPQGLCGSLVNEEILSKVKIIDLSADFRIKDVATYEKWYKIEHKSPQFIDEAVYGLCERSADFLQTLDATQHVPSFHSTHWLRKVWLMPTPSSLTPSPEHQVQEEARRSQIFTVRSMRA